MFGVWIKDVAHEFPGLWDGLPLHLKFPPALCNSDRGHHCEYSFPVGRCDDGFLLCNMQGLDNPKDLKGSFQTHHIFCYLQCSNTTVPAAETALVRLHQISWVAPDFAVKMTEVEGKQKGSLFIYHFYKGTWRRKWQPTPVFLPGEFHEQRSLVGYSPRSRKESDSTEWLSLTHSTKEETLILAFIRKKNITPFSVFLYISTKTGVCCIF